jgi:dTMP kinase
MEADLKKSINRGSFFCFEGIEGAGKSTLISQVSKLLESQDAVSILTREPGGTALGLKIRDILLHGSEMNISALAELLLFFADRSQHLSEVIIPALKENKIILSDRFYYSTIAYQCYGRGLSRSTVDSLIALSLGSFKPDGVIFIDLPVRIGLERASKRSTPDRFEKENISFHERIRLGFLELAKEDPDRSLVLDGTEPANVLAEKCFHFILQKSPMYGQKA